MKRHFTFAEFQLIQGVRTTLPVVILVFCLALSHTYAKSDALIEGAMKQLGVTVHYDPSYVALSYPGGDIPIESGVCSDVIIRAYRHAGIDLQREIHEDMKRNFNAYPQRWRLKRPDRNIDHRRVLNLMTWFKRRGSELPISDRNEDYLPGDVVVWRLDNGLPHIGMVSNMPSKSACNRFLVVHNIGAGVQIEDVLFCWRVIGHYRFIP